MNVLIRSENLSDRDVIWQLRTQACGGNAEADLVDALRDRGFVRVSLLAEVDGKIVSPIMCSGVTIQSDDLPFKSLSLAPMAVLPEFRGQGIGTSLVEAGIEACRQLPYRSIVVLGHPSFDSRSGFSSDLASTLNCPFASGEAWTALELKANVLESVNGTVQYPALFDVFR